MTADSGLLGRRMRAAGAALALLCLTACGGLSLDYAPPAGFDLTGEWVLNEFLSERPPSAQEIRRREDEAVLRGRMRRAATPSAFLVQDFPVLGAQRMTIEQNRDSMGIEYGNGVYRDVSWGRRERNFWDVRAGWEDSTLYIVSERRGIEGVETMTLEEGGKRLRVAVDVDAEGQRVRVVRIYDLR